MHALHGDLHHGRQVVEVPVGRNLDQTCFFAPDERLHPRLCLRLVVDLVPEVLVAQVERLGAASRATA